MLSTRVSEFYQSLNFVNPCQPLSTHLIIANSLIYTFLFAVNTINPRMCVTYKFGKQEPRKRPPSQMVLIYYCLVS